MGRRAADLTTPVPVLGVPASVGVRNWKTTGVDRNAGALLQTWGQCSIGVQTSPGTSRPLVQLPDSYSNNLTQTSNRYITKEIEDISLHIKNNNEKKAILRRKTEESKIKKEVTFKAAGCRTSKDFACCQKGSSGIYSNTGAIKTNPLVAGTASSRRPRLKSSTRYLNGSVVDSEAIGGIIEVKDDTELAKCHGRVLHYDNGDHSENMCNPCGGKQSQSYRCTILGEKISIFEALFKENTSETALTPLFTATHLQQPNTRRQTQLNSQSSRVEKTRIANKPHLLHVNEEIRYRRTPHPACPVHSRANVSPLYHTYLPSDITSIQPKTIHHTQSVTVTKAAVGSNIDNSTLKCSAKSLLGSLSLTPQMATAIKNFQTSPKNLKTSSYNSPQDNITQSVCVSVHAIPKSPPLSLYTVDMGTQRTPGAITQKTVEALQSTQKAHIFKSEPSTHFTMVSFSPDSDKCQKKSLSRAANVSPAKMPFLDNAAQFLDSANLPQKPAEHSLMNDSVPMITFYYKVKPDQIKCRSSPDKAPHLLSIQANSSNSEPILHNSAFSKHTISGVSKSSDTMGESTASVCSITGCQTVFKNTKCRSVKRELKKTTSLTGSLLSSSNERRADFSTSSICLQHLPDTTEVLRIIEAQDKNETNRTLAPVLKSQENKKPFVPGVVPHQQSNSKTCQFTKLQNMSGTVNCGGDVKRHKTNPTIPSNIELQRHKNKCTDNVSNELVVLQSKDHENPKCSQVNNPQNCYSPIKPRFHQQCCLEREQQMPKHHQGYKQTDHELHTATSPPEQTARHPDSNAQQFALGASASHTNSNSESNADMQKHPCHPSPLVTTQKNCEPTFSQTNTEVKPFSHSTGCQNSNFKITLQRQTHTSPVSAVSVPASFIGDRGLPAHTGPVWEFLLQPSAMPPKSSPPLQSRDEEAISRPDLKCSPIAPQSDPGGTRLSHSHPSNAAPLLPPSRQCCRSAGLEQRLKTVEASLAANKNRITTLLNIIQDLETCKGPNRLQRCCKSGLDLKNCSTCQKTACIVYSVEYDFRQQERHFLEVLNQSLSDNSRFARRPSETLNLGLLRNVLFKNFAKTRLKSKKLCKTLLKWIPRKISRT